MKNISREDFVSRYKKCQNYGAMAFPHGCSKAQARRNTKEADEVLEYNAIAREAAHRAFDLLLEIGFIREPTDRERLIEGANGHPDNRSVQACRRLCEKKGIDWRVPA